MIKETTASLFDLHANAIVNTVNCVGVMGKGVALEFKARFPKCLAPYQRACNENRLRPGKPVYLAPQDRNPGILLFPTKDDWKNPSRMDWIESGLRYVRDHYREWGIRSIAMPQLGCGEGGLRWTEVRPLIHSILGNTELDITLCIRESVGDSQSQSGAATARVQMPDSASQQTITSPQRYAKRLIEVDLPIKRISAHARREKSIRHGHISTLHIWWARRPLAACRAVICAALWPDPAPGKTDAPCPPSFIKAARKEMLTWTSHDRQNLLSAESRPRFEAARQKPKQFDDALELRCALLDFIADFANWDNSTVREYLDTSRALTQAAHESLGGEPGTRPLVVDPFAGGGSIPLEALRVGADAFASDLNPVAVLLEKVMLEYIPKYGQRLADEVRKWGEWIKREAEKELVEFYPKDPGGATPIAYLWARTVQCEGPGCGAEVPLIRSFWLAKKANRPVALRLMPNKKAKRVDFQIIVKTKRGWVLQDEAQDPKAKTLDPTFDGTVKRASATCPCCGYTTPVARVRIQLRNKRGGASTARLIAIVLAARAEDRFRLPSKHDIDARERAVQHLGMLSGQEADITDVPDEPVNALPHSINRLPMYGMSTWGDAFSPRQQLALVTLNKMLKRVRVRSNDSTLDLAVRACLSLCISRCVDYWNSLATWAGQFVAHAFGRQALPFITDFAEVSAFSMESGSWSGAIDWVARVIERESVVTHPGQVALADARSHPLPDDAAACVATDPPYYDAISYADLSDFFYVWLRRSLGGDYPELFGTRLTRKDAEIIVESTPVEGVGVKSAEFYLDAMGDAMKEARRVLAPHGIGLVVFAHKSTAGWEAQLEGMLNAGLIVTASWPIDTERPGKVSGIGQARLMSSIHLICRPRENPNGSVRKDEIGDWRDVLQELPRRIHQWMPRLAEEGVVGADAIFACLGPALEIFSRYSRVEKASGEPVTLNEYLEQVWAAVAKEALTMVFVGADTSGFEPDARITAMWLWTLNAGNMGAGNGEESEEEIDEPEGAANAKVTGFVLEYDAARKIAQGLGASLENLDSVVEIKGDSARLLPVAARARYLFGKDEGKIPTKRQNKEPQMDLFKVLEETESDGQSTSGAHVSQVGDTVLDRIHQSMILFAAGRGEALKRFLVEDGAGRDQRFWKLSQALSALYPPNTEEKRWIDGVLARKKGLGF